jgi:hypothetical protein
MNRQTFCGPRAPERRAAERGFRPLLALDEANPKKVSRCMTAPAPAQKTLPTYPCRGFPATTFPLLPTSTAPWAVRLGRMILYRPDGRFLFDLPAEPFLTVAILPY